MHARRTAQTTVCAHTTRVLVLDPPRTHPHTPTRPAGVLTSDPRIVSNTRPVNELTFEEATELAYFGAQVLHPQAMQPAIRSGQMNVRVKNSYNRAAPGTIISSTRPMDCTLVTSIVLKGNVTLVDVVSSRMMGQYGFLATVFNAFRANRISVDVVATSEVSVSCTLDPKKLTGAPDTEMEALKKELDRIAAVSYRQGMAIVSLICNVEKTSEIVTRVGGVGGWSTRLSFIMYIMYIRNMCGMFSYFLWTAG